MTGLLGFLLTDTTDKGQMGLTPLSSIEEQLKLGGRLAALIQLQTGEGQRDVPLLPLPVRLFVEEAVRLVRAGKGLDDLPISFRDGFVPPKAEKVGASAVSCIRSPLRPPRALS